MTSEGRARRATSQPSTYWRLATLTHQPQLRFRRTEARHDAIEVDQSDGFIPSCGFLHAHLRMEPPPALSGAKPIFDMNSRLVEAVKRMFKSYSVEHGLPQPKRCL